MFGFLKVIFNFGQDKNDGSYRQDEYDITDKDTGKHEHKWSKTSTDGQHKEGWVGDNSPRSSLDE